MFSRFSFNDVSLILILLLIYTALKVKQHPYTILEPFFIADLLQNSDKCVPVIYPRLSFFGLIDISECHLTL